VRCWIDLDRGRGELILKRPGAAQIVKSAIDHFNRDRYSLICWTIMPNHVHVVLQLLGIYRLAQVMRSLKRFTSREINALFNRRGTLWQEEYFETLLRSEAHFEKAVKYVLSNPLKIGLENHAWTGIDSHAYSQILGTAAPPPTHGGL
jgi:REP element-mobilizing transposase RayT